ncbi:Ribonuclease II/R [Macrophomina phaseolina MS6]|uniref:Ribonuclease II/R n=1 Tax=Macrophomina phaseolina (strain MS6) TaxID=1126212 RepID=K2RRW7_MACPH|nr:Ribonuclease II/R [Macrophomina phaseolina MS6]
MRSAAALARRSQASRAAKFSNLCWACLLAQRRQLSSTSSPPHSSPRSVRAVRYTLFDSPALPPKEEPEPAKPSEKRTKAPPRKNPAIEEYHKDEKQLLAQLIDQHRRQANEQQAEMNRLAQSNPQNTPGSRRAFHTSSRLKQHAAAAPVTSPHETISIANGRPPNLTTKEYLQRWQEEFGAPNKELLDEMGIEAYAGLSENLTRLGPPSDIRDIEVREDDENQNTAAFRDPEDMLDDDITEKLLKVGDLVEISFKAEREPMIAVFIAQYGLQGQFYSMDGRWFHRRVKQIQFSVSNFIEPELLQPILPFLPKGEVTNDLLDTMQILDINAPREIAAPVIKQLRSFTEDADAAYRRNASILDRAHNLLAHETDLRFGNLQKITETLLRVKNPSIATMYAVRKALLRQPMGFHADGRSHRETSVFQIMPTEFKKRMELAQSWVRDFQEEVARRSAVFGGDKNSSAAARKLEKSVHGGKEQESEGAANVRKFIQKCRKLIDQSRTMRDYTPYGRIGISKVRNEITPEKSAMEDLESLEFTESDAVLIRFIEAWSMSHMFGSAPRISSLPPVVLRALDRYPNQELGHVLGYTFLQEIGVIPPHENRTKFDPHLLLPTASHSRQLELMYNALVRMGADRKKVGMKDWMADLRTDWGKMPVFCIDAASAEEIDDGVSLESIPDSSDHWVHVHIANPTAFLPKTHLISKMAAHLTESIYMPERTYSMLPKWLSDERLSLGPNRPCLTISMRLNVKGEVVDDKIQPGIIRNFVPITPQTLQQVVDPVGAEADQEVPDFTVIVGGNVPELPHRRMKEAQELSKNEKEDLKKLHELALARQIRRTEAGGIFWNQNYPDMSVYHDYFRPGLPWSHPSRRTARYTEGDPVIKMEATPTQSWFQPAGIGSDLMVREMMMLAGEVGALWCKKRNIPIIYRGTLTRPDVMSIEEYKEKLILPNLDANGNPPAKIAFNYLKHAGGAITSTKPFPHHVLGVKQYAKLTSPLRRYGDMLLHWQIESALRKEAELGRSLVDLPHVKQDYLAFQRKEVDAIITRLAPRERLISKTKRQSQAFWLAQLFFRAFYYGEAKLPDTFEVVVFSLSQDAMKRVAVLWQDYSFDLDMAFPSEVGIDEKPEIGDRWEVRITEVDTYNRRVKSEPIRLISREVVPADLPF